MTEKEMHDCLQKCCDLVGMPTGSSLLDLHKYVTELVIERNRVRGAYFSVLDDMRSKDASTEFTSRYYNE